MLNFANGTQANNSGIPTRKPMGFGEILDTIFSLYRRHFLLFLGIIAIYFFGGLVEYVLWHLLPHFFLKSYIIDLIGIPFSLISMGGIIVVTAKVYLDQHITIREALKQALHRLWHIGVCDFPWSFAFEAPRMGVIYCLAFAITPESALISTTSIPIPYILIVWLAGVPFLTYLAIPWSNSISRLMTSIIGSGLMWTRFISLALAPLSIYFAVRWTFVPTAVLLEKSSIRRAFGKSWELTRGKWWHAWGMLISFSVISFAIRRILQITIKFILILLKVEGAKVDMDTIRGMITYIPIDTDTLFYTLTVWSNQIVGAFIFPIWVIGITLLYFDLRIRKERFDIELQADSSTTREPEPTGP